MCYQTCLPVVAEFRTCSLFKEPTEEEERERGGKTGEQHQPNREPLCLGVGMGMCGMVGT